MSGFLRSVVAGAAALIGMASAAHAADLYGGGMKDYGYKPPLMTHASWYLRLDGAYAFHDAPVMVTTGIDDLTKTGLNDTWTIGGGIGYYFTPSIRGDLTIDYRFESDAHGRNVSAGATFPGTHRFGLDSTVLLANLYYDFNRGGRINPYVGGGLGAVYHQTSVGTTQLGGTIAASDSWHVAGHATAGLTVALADRLTLDAAYRFLYLGETKAGGVTDGFGNLELGPTVEDIHAHEFRLGLRYDIR